MATTATVTFTLTDLLGGTFDTRRTKVWITTNVPGDVLIDATGDEIRLGDAPVTLNDDGTGSFVTWVPGAGLNPASWQTHFHVDYQRTGTKQRATRKLGPFTITADADLADLVAEHDVPPEQPSFDTGMTAVDADPASDFRIQQDARHQATYALKSVRIAYKAADTTRNNTATRTDDPDMVIAVDPGTYTLDALLFYNGTTTADMRVEITTPASSSLWWSPNAPHAGQTGSAITTTSRVLVTAGSALLGAVGSPVAAMPAGTIVVTTAGNVALSWAQSTAEVSDLTMLAGSYLRLEQVLGA